MQTIKYKTNIKCGGCIAAVTPYLNELKDLEKWEVDTNSPDKVLTVRGNSDSIDQEVVESLKKAGYTAEKI
jgi:copper chaperone